MKLILLFGMFLLSMTGCRKPISLEIIGPDNGKEGFSLLALGDSYTIGQSVAEEERWPNQLTARLRASNFLINQTDIIARTGWTTLELEAAIQARQFSHPYQMVTLLIGVNDQYRGYSLSSYQTNFEHLLKTAIVLANGEKSRVVVLSIPDYSVTPFAKNLNIERIRIEIDQFNWANSQIAQRYGVHYVNVTTLSRQAQEDPELLAPDQLHPSGKMYGLWVDLILPVAQSILGRDAERGEKPLLFVP